MNTGKVGCYGEHHHSFTMEGGGFQCTQFESLAEQVVWGMTCSNGHQPQVQLESGIEAGLAMLLLVVAVRQSRSSPPPPLHPSLPLSSVHVLRSQVKF